MDGQGQPQDQDDTRAGVSGPAAPRPPSDPWRAFLTPADGTEFLSGWLAIACSRIENVTGAALFLRGDAGRLGLAARWRLPDTSPEPVTVMAEAVLRKPEPLIQRDAGQTLLGYPIETGPDVQGVLVLVLSQHPDAAVFRRTMRELHWSCGWIEARLWQGQAALGRKQADTARLLTALLAAVESHERFDGAALALVNAIPEVTGFDAAALGMVRRGRVRLEALSRVAAFGRRTERVGTYEAAMDEALAQAEAVAWPERPDGRRMIDLAHRTLGQYLGAGAVVSAPLTVRGRVVGVLTLERGRGADEALALAGDAVDELRLVAAALSPVLKAKFDERRLVSGRLRHWIGRSLSAVFGRRPAIALGALALLAVLAVPFFVPAPLRVRADATVEGATQQAAVAPIDGFLADAPARAGDRVTAGQLLARLDDRDLRLEHATNTARVAQARQTLREALSTGDRAAAAVANAELSEAVAAADLTAARLARLDIVAPIDGLIVSGDLSQRIGSPLSRGDTLYEIAEEDGWRLRIDVSEYDLALVGDGQEGRAVFSGLSGADVPFVVTGIASVSDPGAGENRFRVEADVTSAPPAMRPGLTGTAKITTGETTLAWAWTRGTVVRMRLFLWGLLP